jgi:hypothetical protein
MSQAIRSASPACCSRSLRPPRTRVKEVSAGLDGPVDRELGEDTYIRPGLGDAGDRVFGTG